MSPFAAGFRCAPIGRPLLDRSLPGHAADGYTRLFQNLVAACGNLLRLELESDYHEAAARANYDFLVYTGPIDDYFQHCYGRLPYRSLCFDRNRSRRRI